MDVAAMGELVMAGFQKLGFIRYAGITGVDFAAGRNVVALDPKPEHLNHNGDLHAAVLFGLAETAAMGAAVSGIGDLMGESFVVARDGRIAYRARAAGKAGPYRATGEFSDEVLERMRADIAARTDVELEVPVRIVDGDDNLVAEAAFTAVIRPRRK
ncbi:PaaI family thioesterase [Nocardia takedensis]|uniref:PaaI family thioesterase n=1 Tax=Nocardia takedensis TaxID=259390 RepID=UPI0002EEEC16|nr:DUF4442 domain-containing protein [Nocardia takedensis]